MSRRRRKTPWVGTLDHLQLCVCMCVFIYVFLSVCVPKLRLRSTVFWNFGVVIFLVALGELSFSLFLLLLCRSSATSFTPKKSEGLQKETAAATTLQLTSTTTNNNTCCNILSCKSRKLAYPFCMCVCTFVYELLTPHSRQSLHNSSVLIYLIQPQQRWNVQQTVKQHN